MDRTRLATIDKRCFAYFDKHPAVCVLAPPLPRCRANNVCKCPGKSGLIGKSHVAYMSFPKEAAALIEEAAMARLLVVGVRSLGRL